MWVIASLCPTIGSQLDHSLVQNSHICSSMAHHTVKLEEILTHFKTITPNKLKIQATQLIKGHIGSFRTILDSFQDPCLNHHKFNILDSILYISHQNKCQPLNFKFLNLLCPSRSIVATYEQIWLSVKNTQKVQ